MLEVYPNPAGPPWCLVKTVDQGGQLPDSPAREGVVPSVILNSFPKVQGANSNTYSSPQQVPRTISRARHQRPSSEGNDNSYLD